MVCVRVKNSRSPFRAALASTRANRAVFGGGELPVIHAQTGWTTAAEHVSMHPAFLACRP